MYSTSAMFQTLIKEKIRKFYWSGTINTPTPINFTNKNVISGELVRSISGESLEVGTVYSSQLTLEMDLPSVNRYELYGVTITLNCELDGASDVVPMGIFTITEALQQKSKVTITAYDDMIKFDDVTFSASLNNSIEFPYTWLTKMCGACGVVLGSTSAEIQSLPNGNRKTGFADSVADVQTWRDVLGYLGAYLGGFAYIGRDGKLYIGSYKSTASDIVPNNFRFSSNLSDFRTTYDGLYAICKAEGTQEYVSNTNTDGIVLDLGTNPFLQFSNAQSRENAMKEIINAWNGIYYVPFSSEMPLMPHYDPADVLEFTGNQADVYDYGAITEITYVIKGTMNVICSGDNPRLAEAQDRFSKTIEGLASNYSNGQEIGDKNFWLLHSENTEPLTVGSIKTQVSEIEYNQTTDVQRLGFTFTCDGDLSATAIVKVEITVDDELDYTFEISHKYLNGLRHIPVTWGSHITGKGLHTAKVYMTVTDAPLTWGELA